MIKTAKIFTAIAMGAFFLTATLTSCDNGSDSKEVKKDSTVIKIDTMKPMSPKDSMPMDTKMPDKKPVTPGSGGN